MLTGLRATTLPAIPVPPWNAGRHAELFVPNPRGVQAVTERTAQAVHAARRESRFILLLGGDCSILLGAGLGLRSHARYGLVFIDGHADFYLPRPDHHGGIAGMDLALATGRGPSVLANWHGRAPLFRDEDVFVVGYRDEAEAQELDMPSLTKTGIRSMSLHDMRGADESALVDTLLATVAEDTNGFLVHLDADVLADDVMPCVDSRQPGGLSYDELSSLLIPLLADPRAIGFEVTIYDPSLDPELRYGSMLATALNRVLKAAGFAAQT
ncbi:arginase family protein [Geodermatophilus sp. SYSU D00700]